ncbi:olfactomedin-like [Micropterus dolomieu]|uniref:olfactomedin-like n=2 Tax=Micropterus dolomieu TaxID=147949 RepID=UPI001E8D4FF0|nr:olfactomedin-like [Micropterus dolomieu]
MEVRWTPGDVDTEDRGAGEAEAVRQKTGEGSAQPTERRTRGDGQAQRVSGQRKNGSCVCAVDSNLWTFPAVKYESVLQQVQSCEGSLNNLQEQVTLSSQRLPQIQALVKNMTARLEPHQYLHNQTLYTALSLRLLGQELSQLETDVGVIHKQLNNGQTQKLSKEVSKLRADVDRKQMSDTINMKTVREKLRYLKNTAESCKSIPKDFRGQDRYCLKGLITNISEPVMTKVSPHGKSYISGSWGKQAQMDSEGEKNSYWVQPLLSSHIWGNSLRVYQTYEDFMASANYRDFTFAPSYSHADSIEGPSAVLYGEALYYHCYRSADVCRYDLKSNAVKRVTLPGTGVGFNNKFPYCYYDCRANSDVDVEADETGLWAIYATVGNHGNLVVSRLVWDSEAETLNVSQTWETRLFKKAVSNAFMVCGVLYATRFVDEYREEVFYAFDTATGKEDNSLALPLEKVAKGVASLSYNPINRQIYMYNDGYLLAYQANF